VRVDILDDMTVSATAAGFAQKVGVSDPLARYARVSPSRGGEYILATQELIPSS
jgi:hypothetical protein